jgi:hypothetical protein
MSLCSCWLTDQKVDGALRPLLVRLDGLQVALEQRGEFTQHQVGRQFGLHGGGVGKRHLLGVRFQEEVERVVDRHFHHQVHRDLELPHRLGEHQPGLVVGERVLLPVDEVFGRLDGLRIRQHLGAAVRGRAQAHHLGPRLTWRS